ncbi:MAG: hypothetical protein HY869_12305 [Chloroflexi bacterium]|nr:hypothetical protein [Chloroflexota bacterium]
MTETVSGILIILLGLLTMIGSVLNWGLVTRPGKLLNILLGDMVARTIYFVIGILLLVLGVDMAFGLHWIVQ